MTPIKYFGYQGLAIYSVDMADKRTLICVCADERQFEWLLACLKMQHSKDAIEIFVS